MSGNSNKASSAAARPVLLSQGLHLSNKGAACSKNDDTWKH